MSSADVFEQGLLLHIVKPVSPSPARLREGDTVELELHASGREDTIFVTMVLTSIVVAKGMTRVWDYVGELEDRSELRGIFRETKYKRSFGSATRRPRKR
jgi:hypothetical protein